MTSRPRLLCRRALVAAAAAFAATPGVAHADSVGPTDYETVIADVTPEVDDAVTFSVEGSDAFVRASVAPGHELVVLGYDGEEYIWIDAAGRVFENHRSESYFYNQERFGADVPADADSAATPDWVEVDDDGEHAWHDHRAHWMAATPLIGMGPGDSFPTEEIPVIVDGTPVTISVVTTLLPTASPLIPIATVAVGLAVVVALWRSPRRLGVPLAAVTAFAAIIAGAAETVAVPASTGRSLVWWALPLAALATVAAAWWIRTDGTRSAVLIGAAGVELVWWSANRSAGLLAAYRPTVLPIWIDRMVTTATLVIAFGLVANSIRVIITSIGGSRGRSEPDPASPRQGS